ncbi:MAG: CvpA family protein [Rikenellaceae bacterium]
MNGIDIALLVILIYGAYRGFRNGIIVELCGILGIVIGAYVAYHFSDELATHISLPKDVAMILSFLIIFITIILTISIIARVVSKILSFGGLGVVNSLLGAVASVIKIGVVLSLLVSSFITLNTKTGWMEQSTLKKSEMIPKLQNLSHMLFPYIDFLEKYFDKLDTDK